MPPAVPLVIPANSRVPGEDPEFTAMLRQHPAYAMFCLTWEDYLRLKPIVDLLVTQSGQAQRKGDEDVSEFAEACRRRGFTPAQVGGESTEQALSAARQAIVRELAAAGWNAKRIARFVYRESVSAVLNVIAKGKRGAPVRSTDNAAVNAK